QRDGLRFPVDVNGNAFFRAAIDDAVSLDAVAVGRECLVPAAKVNARLAASPNVIVANEIVRITVAEGHPIVAILDHVLFVKSVLGAPAEVDALGAMPHSVAPHDRALRSGTGVKGKPGTVVEVTVLNDHVVRNSPDDAVAVEIAHRRVTYGNAIGFVQANAAIVERATVEHFVVGLVSIDTDALDDDISDVRALKEREIGGDLRLPL